MSCSILTPAISHTSSINPHPRPPTPSPKARGSPLRPKKKNHLGKPATMNNTLLITLRKISIINNSFTEKGKTFDLVLKKVKNIWINGRYKEKCKLFYEIFSEKNNYEKKRIPLLKIKNSKNISEYKYSFSRISNADKHPRGQPAKHQQNN